MKKWLKIVLITVLAAGLALLVLTFVKSPHSAQGTVYSAQTEQDGQLMVAARILPYLFSRSLVRARLTISLSSGEETASYSLSGGASYYLPSYENENGSFPGCWIYNGYVNQEESDQMVPISVYYTADFSNAAVTVNNELLFATSGWEEIYLMP